MVTVQVTEAGMLICQVQINEGTAKQETERAREEEEEKKKLLLHDQ